MVDRSPATVPLHTVPSASISATPDTGYSFAGWTGDGVTDPDQASTFVIMKEDRNLTANFALRDVDKVLLSVSVLPTTGGTVMGADEYDNNANASIIAIPSSGYSFGGWTGDGITDPNHASTTVLMSEDRNISANFTINSYDLFISTETGGTIEGNGTFEYGSYANIFATPDTGYSFSRWTGSGVHDPLDFNTTVHMTEDRNISASFDPHSYALAISFNQGGSVTGSDLYLHGTEANISAISSSGYSFGGWTWRWHYRPKSCIHYRSHV